MPPRVSTGGPRPVTPANVNTNTTNTQNTTASRAQGTNRQTPRSRSGSEPPGPPVNTHTTARNTRRYYPITADELDTVRVVSAASGLTIEQHKCLSQTWNEARQFIQYLANLDASFLDFQLVVPGVGATAAAIANARLAQITAQRNCEASVSNVYYSRLWEQQYGVMRYGLPLRAVHNFYMLQMQPTEDPTIVIGGRGRETYEAARKRKVDEVDNAIDAYKYPRMCHYGDFEIPKDLHISTSKKRFPAEMTPVMFWGMLQIFWIENLTRMIRFLPLLVTNDQVLKMLDRMRGSLDKYYEACNFIPITDGKSYTDVFYGDNKTFRPFPNDRTDVTGKPIPTVAFTTRLDFHKPIDPFHTWRAHLTSFPTLRNFDFMLGKHLNNQFAGKNSDTVRMAKVYGKAQYLIRVCEIGNDDGVLIRSINTLVAAFWNGEFNPVHAPAQGTNVLSLSRLTETHNIERQAVQSTRAIARLHQEAITAGAAEEPTLVPALYTQLTHNLFVLNDIRNYLSLLVDTYGDDIVLQSIAMENVPAERINLFESDLTAFWLQVAGQYGYIAAIDRNPDEAARNPGPTQKALLPLGSWAEDVKAENAVRRAAHLRTMESVIASTRLEIVNKKIAAASGRPTATAAAATATATATARRATTTTATAAATTVTAPAATGRGGTPARRLPRRANQRTTVTGQPAAESQPAAAGTDETAAEVEVEGQAPVMVPAGQGIALRGPALLIRGSPAGLEGPVMVRGPARGVEVLPEEDQPEFQVMTSGPLAGMRGPARGISREPEIQPVVRGPAGGMRMKKKTDKKGKGKDKA